VSDSEDDVETLMQYGAIVEGTKAKAPKQSFHNVTDPRRATELLKTVNAVLAGKTAAADVDATVYLREVPGTSLGGKVPGRTKTNGATPAASQRRFAGEKAWKEKDRGKWNASGVRTAADWCAQLLVWNGQPTFLGDDSDIDMDTPALAEVLQWPRDASFDLKQKVPLLGKLGENGKWVGRLLPSNNSTYIGIGGGETKHHSETHENAAAILMGVILATDEDTQTVKAIEITGRKVWRSSMFEGLTQWDAAERGEWTPTERLHAIAEEMRIALQGLPGAADILAVTARETVVQYPWQIVASARCVA
jgi:hypothetical protein